MKDVIHTTQRRQCGSWSVSPATSFSHFIVAALPRNQPSIATELGKRSVGEALSLSLHSVYHAVSITALEERADTRQAEFMEVVYFVKENTNTDSISVASFSLSGSPRLQFQAGILREIPFPFSIRQEGFVSDKKEKLILFFEIKGLC